VLPERREEDHVPVGDNHANGRLLGERLGAALLRLLLLRGSCHQV
jgi:hypothetical protein